MKILPKAGLYFLLYEQVSVSSSHLKTTCFYNQVITPFNPHVEKGFTHNRHLRLTGSIVSILNVY